MAVIGDLAVQQGEAEVAREWYARSLLRVENPQVRASLVELWIETSDWQQALKTIGATPGSLTLQVQKLIVNQRLGNPIEKEADQLRHRFEHWIEEHDYEHAREMARFYLDVDQNREAAHRLAQINATLQHEPEDALLLKRTQAN
jgi:thioredoxin-like negative regulator of GroEL